MNEQTTEEVLAEAAAAAAAKPKKERVKKAEGEVPAGEPKAKKERAPKEPKAPKLDADGNPIVRSRVLPSNGDAKITWDEAKVGKYRGARAEFAAMRADGQTIDEYVAAGGDKGFLRFYVRDGAATVA